MTDKKVKFVVSAEDRATQVMRRVKGQLEGVQGSAEKLSGALGLIGPGFLGAFSVAGVAAFISSTARGIDRLNDLSDASGASIENLSALEDVAARTGTSFDAVGDTLVKFNKLLIEAKPGSQTEKILERLGLSAAELKKLDPAEALRRTAVALANYADDGNKARLVQELFGKGLKEIAPLLKDLSTQSELVATVTTEEAQAAEKFNQQLSRLQKNASDAARSLVSELLPSINKLFEAAKSPRGLFGSFTDQLGIDFLRARLQATNDEIERLRPGAERARGILANQPDSLRANAAVAEFEALLKQAEEYRAKIDETLYGGKGRRPAREGGGGFTLPSVGDVPGSGKPSKVDALSPFVGPIMPDEIKDALAAVEATDLGKIDALRVRLDALLSLGRGGDPKVVDAIRKTREEIDELTAKGFGPAILDPREEQKQSFLRSEKAAYDEIKDEIKGLDEFAMQAGRNIQNALGDTLARTLRGDFESIGELWRNLLLDMAAQALAAQLNKYLFGDIFSGGSNSGALGSILSTFLPSFDKGTDYVPRDMVAKIHRGERILTAEENRRGVGGLYLDASGATFHIQGPGVTMTEVAAAFQANNAMLEAKVNRLLQRRGVV